MTGTTPNSAKSNAGEGKAMYGTRSNHVFGCDLLPLESSFIS